MHLLDCVRVTGSVLSIADQEDYYCRQQGSANLTRTHSQPTVTMGVCNDNRQQSQCDGMSYIRHRRSDPGTAHPNPQRLTRRHGIEDYQRRIVEKIKRHFERHQYQWESNLQKQADVFNSSPKVSDTCHHHGDIGLAEVTSPRLRQCVEDKKQKTNDLRVVSSQCHRQGPSSSKWRFEVDITDFLPNGEVLVSIEGETLTATAHWTTHCRSRGADTAMIKRQLVVEGYPDSGSLQVTTSQTGTMVIEVLVRHTADTSTR